MRAFDMLRGFFFATLFIALWFWLASLVRRFDPLLGFVPPLWLVPVGWVLGTAGGILALYCVAAFAIHGRGTPAPFDPPRVFVVQGPYRSVRNPMYIGAICCLLGAGLVVRSFSILLLALAFWAVSHILVVLYEEPVLERQFGEAFLQYRQKVRRWLPGIPRR
jgi:protein-S-isoprenylcysteine O-methyltransferase Ste14